ncbi:hypothetical protein BDR26DRAFT_868691 [Obelidium mucronatum]|nr:hypothetical protein BDR26DRAFT_868691 [Obelidium mucronatum]
MVSNSTKKKKKKKSENTNQPTNHHQPTNHKITKPKKFQPKKKVQSLTSIVHALTTSTTTIGTHLVHLRPDLTRDLQSVLETRFRESEDAVRRVVVTGILGGRGNAVGFFGQAGDGIRSSSGIGNDGNLHRVSRQEVDGMRDEMRDLKMEMQQLRNEARREKSNSREKDGCVIGTGAGIVADAAAVPNQSSSSTSGLSIGSGGGDSIGRGAPGIVGGNVPVSFGRADSAIVLQNPRQLQLLHQQQEEQQKLTQQPQEEQQQQSSFTFFQPAPTFGAFFQNEIRSSNNNSMHSNTTRAENNHSVPLCSKSNSGLSESSGGSVEILCRQQQQDLEQQQQQQQHQQQTLLHKPQAIHFAPNLPILDKTPATTINVGNASVNDDARSKTTGLMNGGGISGFGHNITVGGPSSSKPSTVQTGGFGYQSRLLNSGDGISNSGESAFDSMYSKKVWEINESSESLESRLHHHRQRSRSAGSECISTKNERFPLADSKCDSCVGQIPRLRPPAATTTFYGSTVLVEDAPLRVLTVPTEVAYTVEHVSEFEARVKAAAGEDGGEDATVTRIQLDDEHAGFIAPCDLYTSLRRLAPQGRTEQQHQPEQHEFRNQGNWWLTAVSNTKNTCVFEHPIGPRFCRFSQPRLDTLRAVNDFWVIDVEFFASVGGGTCGDDDQGRPAFVQRDEPKKKYMIRMPARPVGSNSRSWMYKVYSFLEEAFLAQQKLDLERDMVCVLRRERRGDVNVGGATDMYKAAKEATEDTDFILKSAPVVELSNETQKPFKLSAAHFPSLCNREARTRNGTICPTTSEILVECNLKATKARVSNLKKAMTLDSHPLDLLQDLANQEHVFLTCKDVLTDNVLFQYPVGPRFCKVYPPKRCEAGLAWVTPMMLRSGSGGGGGSKAAYIIEIVFDQMNGVGVLWGFLWKGPTRMRGLRGWIGRGGLVRMLLVALIDDGKEEEVEEEEEVRVQERLSVYSGFAKKKGCEFESNKGGFTGFTGVGVKRGRDVFGTDSEDGSDGGTDQDANEFSSKKQKVDDGQMVTGSSLPLSLMDGVPSSPSTSLLSGVSVEEFADENADNENADVDNVADVNVVVVAGDEEEEVANSENENGELVAASESQSGDFETDANAVSKEKVCSEDGHVLGADNSVLEPCSGDGELKTCLTPFMSPVQASDALVSDNEDEIDTRATTSFVGPCEAIDKVFTPVEDDNVTPLVQQVQECGETSKSAVQTTFEAIDETQMEDDNDTPSAQPEQCGETPKSVDKTTVTGETLKSLQQSADAKRGFGIDITQRCAEMDSCLKQAPSKKVNVHRDMSPMEENQENVAPL